MRTRTLSKLIALTFVIGLPCFGIWHSRRDRAAASSRAAHNSCALLQTLSTGGSGLADKAISAWTKKLRKNDKDALAWAGLGDALMQKARETADVSYYGLAEKAYGECLARDSKSPAGTLGMAWTSGGRHEFAKSIEWSYKALEINPSEQAAYGLIGDAQIELGQYDAAFQSYQKMLDLKPDLASYSRGAHLLFLTGDTRKAIALMTRAIETGGPFAENTAWCRAQLGLILLANGNVRAAEQLLVDAAKRSPNNYHVQAAIGKLMAAKRDYPSAIVAYRKAVAMAPQIDSLVALGDLLTLIGKRDEAERQFDQVEAIHKIQRANGALGDRLIAQFYADHDRNLPEALRLAEEEYKRFPNVYAADTLAWCLYKNGNYPEAHTMIGKALALRTPDAQILYHAGMIDAKLGDRRVAQKRLYEALSLNPGFNPVGAKEAVATLKDLGSQKAL